MRIFKQLNNFWVFPFNDTSSVLFNISNRTLSNGMYNVSFLESLGYEEITIDELNNFFSDWLEALEVVNRKLNCKDMFDYYEKVLLRNQSLKIRGSILKKMTPEEYGADFANFPKHIAVSQEVIDGIQEIWVIVTNNSKIEVI